MEPEKIRAIIEQARQAWISGDASAFAELFALDGKFVVPGKVYRGRVAIREVTASFAVLHSNVTIDIRRVIVDGCQAVVEWQWEDTRTATGARHIANDAIVVDFRNGKIVRWREYIDAISPVADSAA
jgi:uncharacterized protein (TIGR02246 family)